MKAVANSSILIALSLIGKLELLSQRFPDGIVIPQAVWREVAEAGKGHPGSEQVSIASWISVRDVKDHDLVTVLRAKLDEGEAEAIALARDLKLTVVLLDEKEAREIARRLELQVIGTIGLLIWAKQVGELKKLKEQLDILRWPGKFRVSQSIYDEAIRIVGEDD